jgi:hypothetical protein
MVGAISTTVRTTLTVVKIGRCWKFLYSNGLIIGLENGRSDAEHCLSDEEHFLCAFDLGLCVGDLGLGNEDHGRKASDYLLVDQENGLPDQEDILLRKDHGLGNREHGLRDAHHLHDDGDHGHGRTENDVVRLDHGLNFWLKLRPQEPRTRQTELANPKLVFGEFQPARIIININSGLIRKIHGQIQLTSYNPTVFAMQN